MSASWYGGQLVRHSPFDIGTHTGEAAQFSVHCEGVMPKQARENSYSNLEFAALTSYATYRFNAQGFALAEDNFAALRMQLGR